MMIYGGNDAPYDDALSQPKKEDHLKSQQKEFPKKLAKKNSKS